MQSTISSDCTKLSIDCQAGPQLDPKLLFQVSIRELHNRTAITYEEGGTKEARDIEYKIIINGSTLRKILPPQLKEMTDQCKIMRGCEFCISNKIMH